MFNRIRRFAVLIVNALTVTMGTTAVVMADTGATDSGFGYAKWIIFGGILAGCVVTVMTLRSED